MSIDHLKQIEAPGSTAGGYVKSFTLQAITEYLGCTPNDDTDNGVYVLNDGNILRVTFEENESRFGFTFSLNGGTDFRKPGGNCGSAGCVKEFTNHLLDFFVDGLKTQIAELLGRNDLISDPDAPDAPGDELGKSETETEQTDTSALGESTPPHAAVDPAESVTSEPETAPETTASTTGKKSKKSNAEPAE